MPAETESIPEPGDWGHSAQDWLEAHGLVARKPTIRSSDFEMALSCPFKYYLTRRLGLSEAIRYSEAMSTGSWFHKRFEYYDLSDDQAEMLMNQHLDARQKELKEVCKHYGFMDDTCMNILEKEEHDRYMAESWYEALKSVRIPDLNCTFVEYMKKPHWEDLGPEIRAIYQHAKGTLVAQFDRLLYHAEQKTIWIIDLKTTGESPTDRLQICPIEFQTQHYLFILQGLIENGTVQKEFKLPDDVRVGGFIHIGIQRPTIKFGSGDRDYEEVEHVLKSGPRKGEVEIRRVYQGDPRKSNYIDRCKRWYLCEGEYEHQKDNRKIDPVINISRTFAREMLDKPRLDLYLSRLAMVEDLANRKPLPILFPMSANAVKSFGRLSPFAPFYLTHPKEWPGIVQQQRFMTTWRDEDILDDSSIEGFM